MDQNTNSLMNTGTEIYMKCLSKCFIANRYRTDLFIIIKCHSLAVSLNNQQELRSSVQPVHTDHSYFQYPSQPPRSYDRPQSSLQATLQSNACGGGVTAPTSNTFIGHYSAHPTAVADANDNGQMMVGCSPGYLDPIGVYHSRPQTTRNNATRMCPQPAYTYDAYPTHCYHSCCGTVGNPQYLGEFFTDMHCLGVSGLKLTAE